MSNYTPPTFSVLFDPPPPPLPPPPPPPPPSPRPSPPRGRGSLGTEGSTPMLTAEQNELLTRVGPESRMGALMRRYWHPVATCWELKANPVKAVRILGESLTLYRDRKGRLGLIGQRCAHRGVDLKCGIPEDEGLRCPYHGWLYDKTGQCIAQPAELAEHDFSARMKLASYPVEELG